MNSRISERSCFKINPLRRFTDQHVSLEGGISISGALLFLDRHQYVANPFVTKSRQLSHQLSWCLDHQPALCGNRWREVACIQCYETAHRGFHRSA